MTFSQVETLVVILHLYEFFNILIISCEIFRMTDSMNFGPDWIRNLSSEGSTGVASGGIGGIAAGGGTRYQLADYRYVLQNYNLFDNLETNFSVFYYNVNNLIRG